MMAPRVIYEDNHLLVLRKPPGWLAQPDGSGRPDVLSWAGAYRAQGKPGRAYVGLAHRLDRAVGGVLALAKTSKCAARLSRQFRERTAVKIYLALVRGRPRGETGRLEGYLARHGDVTSPATAGEGGTRAALAWRLESRHGALSLLSVRLETGFKHQIRAQLAAAGCPIVGDAKYGGGGGPGPAIGLWAASLTLEHPTKREPMTFEAAPEATLWPWDLIAPKS